jgi:hypothetical protein
VSRRAPTDAAAPRPRPRARGIRVNPVVSLSIALFLGVLAVWGLALAAAGRPPTRAYLVAGVIGEVELVLQGAVAAALLVAGHDPASVGEFLGYLLVTVGLLPVALNRARAPEATRFDAAVVAVTAIAVAVAVLRLQSLW